MKVHRVTFIFCAMTRKPTYTFVLSIIFFHHFWIFLPLSHSLLLTLKNLIILSFPPISTSLTRVSHILATWLSNSFIYSPDHPPELISTQITIHINFSPPHIYSELQLVLNWHSWGLIFYFPIYIFTAHGSFCIFYEFVRTTIPVFSFPFLILPLSPSVLFSLFLVVTKPYSNFNFLPLIAFNFKNCYCSLRIINLLAIKFIDVDVLFLSLYHPWEFIRFTASHRDKEFPLSTFSIRSHNTRYFNDPEGSPFPISWIIFIFHSSKNCVLACNVLPVLALMFICLRSEIEIFIVASPLFICFSLLSSRLIVYVAGSSFLPCSIYRKFCSRIAVFWSNAIHFLILILKLYSCIF